MRKKLMDEIISKGHAETNRYEYKLEGKAIMRRPRFGNLRFWYFYVVAEKDG